MHVCVFIMKCNCNYPLVPRNQVRTASKISFPNVIPCFKSSFSQQSKTHVLGRKKQVTVSKHFEGEETNHNLISLLGSVLCLSSDHTWINSGKEHKASVGPPQSISQFHHSESADLGKLHDQCLFQASHLKKEDNT